MDINRNLSWEQINVNSENVSKVQNVFQYEIDVHTVPSHQMSTGRCWLFAGLNCMRIPFIKQYNLNEAFEFSANYLTFWDKYEKCKYFLETYPNVKIKRVKDLLLNKPVIDGGQWHMFVNLVNKYGVVPKECYYESHAASNTDKLDRILNHKVKSCIKHNKSIDVCMNEIYDILVKYMGTPPEKFTWSFRDKDNNFNRIRNISPQLFYILYVSDYYDVNNYVNVINDPRNKYDTFYTVDYFTNVLNTSGPMYYNMEMNELKNNLEMSISLNEPIWIGCDIYKYTSRLFCLSGKSFYNDDDEDEMSKAERLEMMDSVVNHAMVMHGYTKGENTQYWKLENSWGTNGPYRGYYIADDKWIDEYVYQAILPKKIVKKINTPNKSIKYKKSIKKYPVWDPFGKIRVTAF